MKKAKATDLLLGVAIGDALGVPYEFSTREEMERNPAKEMVGNKVHNQPLGTWSDDSSLTFCLAESLLSGYDLKSTAIHFIKWRDEAYWTAHDEVFDMGITTNHAITRLSKIIADGRFEDLKLLKGDADEYDNGNGSLMRILPFIFEIKDKDLRKQFELVWENSALTHRHIRAAMSCMIYLKLAEYLMNGYDKLLAYQKMRDDILILWNKMDFDSKERAHFKRIITLDISDVKKEEIKSGGYVIESLEASLWCFLTTDSFKSALLSAVNLGEDTDTTGAITGGLAGLYYGRENMPENWVSSLARVDDIIELGEKLNRKSN